MICSPVRTTVEYWRIPNTQCTSLKLSEANNFFSNESTRSIQVTPVLLCPTGIYSSPTATYPSNTRVLRKMTQASSGNATPREMLPLFFRDSAPPRETHRSQGAERVAPAISSMISSGLLMTTG